MVGRIALRDGKLWAYERVNDDSSFELTPIGGNRFVIPNSPVEVEFVPPTAGQLQQLHVTIAGGPTRVSRLIAEYTPSREQLQAFAARIRRRDPWDLRPDRDRHRSTDGHSDAR